MRRRLAGHYDGAGVDMTPMLDIVFILLIFFIVTATFLDERGLTMLAPLDKSPQNPPAIPSILVQIDGENALYIRSKAGLRSVQPSQLEANVQREIVELGGRASVTIQPHPDADHGIVTRAYDAAVQAHAAGVAVRKPDTF